MLIISSKPINQGSGSLNFILAKIQTDERKIFQLNYKKESLKHCAQLFEVHKSIRTLNEN